MRALIFDMDGVIVDSELHWKSVEGFFLKELVPEWNAADQMKIIGLSNQDLYSMLVRDYGLRQTEEEFFTRYQEMAEEIYRNKASLIEGFMPLLSALGERGVPVALSSSSRRSWIDILVSRFNLRDRFAVIVSAEDIEGGQGKPSPIIYLYTARLLGVEPQECVVIEDSRNGVLSAKNAGMYCIGLRNGFNDEQDISGADVIINGYAELTPDMLQGLI